jgi:hypothetical protein
MLRPHMAYLRGDSFRFRSEDISSSIPICSIYRYALPAMAQGFRHPNKFGQELIDPTQVRIIEELAARIKRLLDTREIYIPEYRNET